MRLGRRASGEEGNLKRFSGELVPLVADAKQKGERPERIFDAGYGVDHQRGRKGREGLLRQTVTTMLLSAACNGGTEIWGGGGGG